MPTIWRYIISFNDGYFTGDGFSELIKDMQDSGYFELEDEAKRYAIDSLGLPEDGFAVCRVVYASLHSSF
ncbi:MAG: hypothetical protein AB1861_08460 [Cyanobacteriota bacterium]